MNKNYKRSIKNFGKGLKGGAICFVGVGMFTFPYAIPLGIGVMKKGINDVYNSVQGNYIKNSMMSLQKNQKINKMLRRPTNYIGEGLPTIDQFMGAYLTKNKMDFLAMQEVNLFLQLDSKDKAGNDIEYNTTTHAGNYKMLKELEKSGLITDLQKTFVGRKSLKMERLFLGNSNSKQVQLYKKKRIGQIKENISNQKGFLNKLKALKEELDIGIDKKTKMYNISFKKNDREFNEREVCDILGFVSNGDQKIDPNRFETVRDKDGNIKSISYKKEYVLSMLKNRSRELAQKAKEKLVYKKDNIIESLRQQTVSIGEMQPQVQKIVPKMSEKEIDNVR